MINLISDPMTMVFCAIIIIFAITYFVKLRKNINKIINEVKEVNTKISTFKYVQEIDEEGELVQVEWTPTKASDAFQHFNKLDKLIQKTGSLKSQWVEYCSTLQHPHKDFTVGIAEEPQIRNTVSANRQFTFSNVIASKLNIRTYTSIPNILTGLGLLFTFIGLMMGISQSATGLSSGDIEAAKASLSPLLNGASIAFTTSVVGLALSMAFSFYEKRKFHQVEEQVSKFARLLTARIKYVSADTLATMQLTATIDQTLALQGFHKEQQRATDETIERVCTEFRKALFDSTGSEFDKMSEFMGDLNDSIKTNVEALNESQNNQQKVHEKACETLVNLTDKVSSSLQDNLNKLEERELTRSDRIMETFAKSIDNMESANEANAKNIFDTLTLMNTEFESQVHKNIEIVKDGTADTINSMMGSMQSMVQDNALQFTQTMKDNLAGIMDGLTADIKRTEQAINPLLSTLPDFAEKTQKVSEQLRDITQEQFVLTTNVRNTFAEVNSAGTLLNQSVEKLNSTNDRTLESSNLYMDIMEAVKVSVESMQSCATDIKASSGEINKVSDAQKQINTQIETSMNNVFTDLNKSLYKYTENTDNFMQSFTVNTTKIAKSMDIVFTGLNDGLSDYSGKTNTYMRSLDQHTAEISSHLVEAINELKASVDDIKRKELAA